MGCLSFCNDQDIGTLLRPDSVSISRWRSSAVSSHRPVTGSPIAHAHLLDSVSGCSREDGDFAFRDPCGVSSVTSLWDLRRARSGTLASERASVEQESDENDVVSRNDVVSGLLTFSEQRLRGACLGLHLGLHASFTSRPQRTKLPCSGDASAL